MWAAGLCIILYLVCICDQPLPLAAGADAFLHPTDLNNTAPKASCFTTATGTPLVSDCIKAVAQLQANESAVCSVTNNTVRSSYVTYYIANGYTVYDVALGTNGQCQVILGGIVGANLPCATIADYASKLTSTCGTGSATTAGVYYPSGVVLGPDGVSPLTPNSGGAPPPSPFIALAQINVP